MKQRVITGLLAAVVFIGALFLMYTPVFPAFIALISVIAVYEIEKAVSLKNILIQVASLVVAALMPFAFHFGVKPAAAPFACVYVVVILIFMLIKFETTKFEQAITAIFASVCVPYAFSLMIVFRDINLYFPAYTKVDGIYLILFSYFSAWMTDIFAYFTGSKLGKHKLCPKISPKKSVEGAIGGIIGALLLNIALLAVFKAKFFEGETGLSYASVAALSVVLSVISMCGDLAASTIKRNFGIKDFGNLLPGHGGIMDRFDSVLFVMPVLYAAIYVISQF